jgi:hypothetical protein
MNDHRFIAALEINGLDRHENPTITCRCGGAGECYFEIAHLHAARVDGKVAHSPDVLPVE